MPPDILPSRQTGRAERQIDGQTDKTRQDETRRDKTRQTDGRTDRMTDRQTETETGTGRQTDRQTFLPAGARLGPHPNSAGVAKPVSGAWAIQAVSSRNHPTPRSLQPDLGSASHANPNPGAALQTTMALEMLKIPVFFCGRWRLADSLSSF